MGDLRHRAWISPQGGTGAMSATPTGLALPGTIVQSAGASVKTEVGSVLEGRMTLVALNSLILALVVFYIWTHDIQGGG